MTIDSIVEENFVRNSASTFKNLESWKTCDVHQHALEHCYYNEIDTLLYILENSSCVPDKGEDQPEKLLEQKALPSKALAKNLVSIITQHTQATRQHLTPELLLRLITPACPLWTCREDELPFKDPFWAFYWPGGQGTARYILDNGDLFKNSRVLDVGCGCGAGSIAAAKVSAARVVANDIDAYALTATKINAKLNDVTVNVCQANMIGSDCRDFDTILIGDMFYDEEFANVLFIWLKKLAEMDKMVLIGDPGRHGLTSSRRRLLTLAASYRLPEAASWEHRGFTDVALWRVNK